MAANELVSRGKPHILDFEELYNSNSEFKMYVDRYILKMKCSVEEALKHKLVQNVGKYYTEKPQNEFGVCAKSGINCS